MMPVRQIVAHELGNAADISASEWEATLQSLTSSALVNDRFTVLPGDPIGGGPACSILVCTRPVQKNRLCGIHDHHWLSAGRPHLADWEPPPAPGHTRLSLARLPSPLKYELAYGMLRARDSADADPVTYLTLLQGLRSLRALGIHSLLQYPEHAWPQPAGQSEDQPQTRRLKRNNFLTFMIDELDQLRGSYTREHEFRLDVWRPRRLGYTGQYGGLYLDFTGIIQPWLRDAVKRFLRWRVDIDHSASGMHRDVRTLTMLSEALTQTVGPGAGPQQCDRQVIEQLVAMLGCYDANGRGQRLSSLRTFLAVARQHDWISMVPSRASVYPEDFPSGRAKLRPRALSSRVMAQLESAANLATITDPRWRLLFPLLMQTGLRINDALHLPTDCVIHDDHDAPYLRYDNRKMEREALVPITAELADAIAAQAREMTDRYGAQAILFPRRMRNPRGVHPVGPATATSALQDWITSCEVTDESGSPAKVTPHQFRHTLGTRLINNDVPQEVVRRILDHSSTEMTAHYARLHDSTVRRHWERARKVDIHGNDIEHTQDSPLADAQWTKHHLGRVSQALPNGYCGMPLQQSCPHANACLTCPVFITTPEFLPQHREQLEHTLGIIERAQQRGQLRLIEMNQRTADNLEKIISSLEQPDAEQA